LAKKTNLETFKETASTLKQVDFVIFKEIGNPMKPLTRQEEQILLVIYHLGDTAYLVNIREKLKELTGKTLDVGTIYIPLRRLADRGLLQSAMGAPTAARGGKAIKYYQLTPAGAAALTEMRDIQERLWKGVVL